MMRAEQEVCIALKMHASHNVVRISTVFFFGCENSRQPRPDVEVPLDLLALQ